MSSKDINKEYIDNEEVENSEDIPYSELEQKFQETEEELKKVKESFLRALAEKENLMKRHEKEIEKTRDFAISAFAKDLLEVMENMYRALGSVPKEELNNNEVIKNIYDGIQMVQKSLNNTFDNFDIERVYPAGQSFDPNLHQAISKTASKELENGMVAKVVQAGFTIKGRLLRPAMVVVVEN